MELSFNCFPDCVFHTPTFLSQVTGVVNLDVMTQIYAVFGHGMMQPDVLVVLSLPGPNEMPGLSSADLPTLAGDKVQMFGNDSNRSRLHS
jgi:hypothetical protein